MIHIYNRRNLITTGYWVSGPLNYWYNGYKFVLPDHNHNPHKGLCSVADIKPEQLDNVLQQAKIIRIKEGLHEPIYYTKIERFRYRYGRRNRLMSDHAF